MKSNLNIIPNKKYTDRNLNSVTKPPISNSLASQQGKLLVLNPVTKNRLGKSSVGVSAAPTPVNTSSLKSEKEKDTNGLVPVGTNVWVNSSGGTEAANESQTGDSEKPQTRPAPWVSKSQTNEPEGQEGQSSSATSEALKQAKRRSWADSDDDDDDDPPEKPTPPAPYAVPPQAVEQPRQSATSHAPHSTQDVRYFSDRDGRGDQRPTNNRPFARDGAPTGFQQPPDRDFQKNRFESNNFRGRGSDSREFEGRGFDNRYSQGRFEGGRGHSFHGNSQNRPQNSGYNTNDWSSGSAHRHHTNGASSENVSEEQIALEQARLERELLEKKRQEDFQKREKERQAAERERLRMEEEKNQVALAELQRRQQSIQQHATRQEEKWERGKLPPQHQPKHPQPKSPREYERGHPPHHTSDNNDGRKSFQPKSDSSHPSEEFQQRKILQMPKHLYDPKSSSMIETSHVQKMPQRFDRGFGEETHEKRFHREADGSDHFKTPTDDMEDSRRRDSRFDRDDKKNNQVPTMTAEELRLKAEAREARAKAKLERPPRTAGVLYRYDESGALERVLTEAEKKEIAEKEEARKVAKENREKQFKLMEKKKFDKFATSKSSASSKEEIIPNPGSAEHVSENADAPRVEKESENPKDTDTQDVPTTSDEGVLASEPHDNDASAPELDLEQLEISSDDARQQSVEFVEVKSKRTISQERKEVKGNTSLIVTPPTPSVPPRVSDKVSQKKSTIEVIPPTEDSSRQVVSNLAPSKPAWQAPQATLEVLGVPSPATASESVPPSVEDIESKIDLEKNEKKDRVKHKERDGSKYRRKKEDETDDQNAQVSRRGTGRVDTSAVNMHLLRNNTTSSRQRSSRPENQEKVHEKEDEKLEVSAKVESMPSTSSAEEKLESQDSKVSEESVDEQPETDTSPSTSGRGRGRGNSRGRGGRRGGLGRREVRFSPRTPDSLQEDGSAENPDDANEPSRASWGSSRGRGRGGGDRESARKGFKARGPPLSRERITRGPPAYSPNPE